MTRGVAKPLTLASFIDLHDAAITYLSTEGTYGRVFNKKNQSIFKLSTSIPLMGRSQYGNRHLPHCEQAAK
ncbi:hypothetical protein ELY15_09695 [Legionella sp. km772]|nr:hypothetical protein ELY15_09695 [Legionella sp. km772]